MKESEIQKQILTYLRSLGIWCWRSYNGPEIHGNGFKVKSQSAGRPDIEGVMAGGTYLGIEVKKPKGQRSDAQISWICKAQELGAVAFFAESVDDVIKELHKVRESA